MTHLEQKELSSKHAENALSIVWMLTRFECCGCPRCAPLRKALDVVYEKAFEDCFFDEVDKAS